jgi:mRNA interferase MazF
VIGRGSLVVVALGGDYRKARPALIVQNDMSDDLLSVLVCPLSTTIRDDVPLYRITVDPTEQNGLRHRSQIAVDKPGLVWRFKIREAIGTLDEMNMSKVDRALSLLLGLA